MGRTVGGDVLSPGNGESPSVSKADPWLLCPPLQKFHSGTQGLLLSEVPVALLDALLTQLLPHTLRHRCTSRLLITQPPVTHLEPPSVAGTKSRSGPPG